ncbi:MAG: succinate dehydrogenase cytochrome b subunit [Acidobacteriota bacterium]|nr:succinate dehydrogenase cytochrome b subunit [Acidobacteriota bacterium]
MSFLRTTIGQTALMAVTGLTLYLYVLGHLLGNLQVYLGRDQINGYALLLHSHSVLLWTARVLLLAAVFIHITVGVRLWWLGRHTARPIPYFMKKDVPPAYASRTMMRSGAVILVFVIFHVLHLTTGSLGLPYRELDVYGNLTRGFHIVWVSMVYIAAMLFLGMHLYHGLWTMFPLLGVSHPRYTRILKPFAHTFAILIAAANISIPLAVLSGWLRN